MNDENRGEEAFEEEILRIFDDEIAQQRDTLATEFRKAFFAQAKTTMRQIKEQRNDDMLLTLRRNIYAAGEELNRMRASGGISSFPPKDTARIMGQASARFLVAVRYGIPAATNLGKGGVAEIIEHARSFAQELHHMGEHVSQDLIRNEVKRIAKSLGTDATDLHRELVTGIAREFYH